MSGATGERGELRTEKQVVGVRGPWRACGGDMRAGARAEDRVEWAEEHVGLKMW